MQTTLDTIWAVVRAKWRTDDWMDSTGMEENITSVIARFATEAEAHAWLTGYREAGGETATIDGDDGIIRWGTEMFVTPLDADEWERLVQMGIV